MGDDLPTSMVLFAVLAMSHHLYWASTDGSPKDQLVLACERNIERLQHPAGCVVTSGDAVLLHYPYVYAGGILYPPHP